MNFLHQVHYGRDCFYPLDKKAEKFLKAFPHSSGKRKSLTLEQVSMLNELGIPLLIKETNLFQVEPMR